MSDRAIYILKSVCKFDLKWNGIFTAYRVRLSYKMLFDYNLVNESAPLPESHVHSIEVTLAKFTLAQIRFFDLFINLDCKIISKINSSQRLDYLVT
ncbi:hypothetical protein BpHYR1_021873 [Brachionus plicatilis]|uniref:Uncharacterized protein n=1 Tax=Brachionus plicatilis TaxID=10195 RepID=A0A3M7T4K9_BRAPC|nr:hypothetical protein BpHYR1_021873 [Brachionus plicatilis]